MLQYPKLVPGTQLKNFMCWLHLKKDRMEYGWCKSVRSKNVKRLLHKKPLQSAQFYCRLYPKTSEENGRNKENVYKTQRLSLPMIQASQYL